MKIIPHFKHNLEKSHKQNLQKVGSKSQNVDNNNKLSSLFAFLKQHISEKQQSVKIFHTHIRLEAFLTVLCKLCIVISLSQTYIGLQIPYLNLRITIQFRKKQVLVYLENHLSIQTRKQKTNLLKIVQHLQTIQNINAMPHQHPPHIRPPLLHWHPGIADTQTQGHSCYFLPR